MTRIQILTILTPIVGALCIGALIFVTNYFDDMKAEVERKARLSQRNDHHVGTASAAE